MKSSTKRPPLPSGFWLLRLSIWLSVLAGGCEHAPTESTARAATDPLPSASASTPRDELRDRPRVGTAPIYKPLPRDRIDTLRATDFGLLRCSYRVNDRWYSLDCEIPGGELSSDARREFEAAISRLAQPQADDRASRLDESPLRLFHLNVRERWIFDLEIADDGFERPITIHRVGDKGSLRVGTDAGHLSAELRRHALETLVRSGERPRRAPRWHAFALAHLIEPAGTTSGDRSASSRKLFERLAAGLLDAPEIGHGSRLAALLVPSVDLLTDGQGAVLLNSEVTVAHVLPLTRKALGGDAHALHEIFRLAMEYGGDPAVFVAAARRLFPVDLNPALVARHPPSRDRDEALLLLATLRRSLERAKYESTQGWSLPVK